MSRKKSLYITKYNKDSKRFINQCILCGTEGYAPQVDEVDFAESGKFHRAIKNSLLANYQVLKLNDIGVCESCEEIANQNRSNA